METQPGQHLRDPPPNTRPAFPVGDLYERGLGSQQLREWHQRLQLLLALRARAEVAGLDGTRITAHAGGSLERNFVRLLVGDRVVVELAPRDGTRGRIVRKA